MTPHVIIAITETTRVRHTSHPGRSVAAVWRGFVLAATYITRSMRKRP